MALTVIHLQRNATSRTVLSFNFIAILAYRTKFDSDAYLQKNIIAPLSFKLIIKFKINNKTKKYRKKAYLESKSSRMDCSSGLHSTEIPGSCLKDDSVLEFTASPVERLLELLRLAPLLVEFTGTPFAVDGGFWDAVASWLLLSLLLLSLLLLFALTAITINNQSKKQTDSTKPLPLLLSLCLRLYLYFYAIYAHRVTRSLSTKTIGYELACRWW